MFKLNGLCEIYLLFIVKGREDVFVIDVYG